MNSLKILSRSKWIAFPASVLAIVAVVFSAALVQDVHNVHVGISGNANNFHIEAAGSVDPSWDPTTGPWFAGGSDVAISPFGILPDVAPGQSLAAKFAVRDTSTTLPGALTLDVVDPDPVGVSSPVADLFTQLNITITKNGQTLFDGPITGANSIVLGDDNPGEIVVFDLVLSFPQSLDNSYENSRTGVQLQVKGESK